MVNEIFKKNPLVYEKKQKLFEQYNFILPGYNVRPNEIYAAIGIQQLKKLDKMIIQRRKIWPYLKNYFLKLII